MWGQDHVGCVSQPPKQTTWPPNSDKPTGARTHAHGDALILKQTLPHACIIKFGNEHPHKCMQLRINSLCFVKPLHSRNPLSLYDTAPHPGVASLHGLTYYMLWIAARTSLEHVAQPANKTVLEVPNTTLVAETGRHKWGSQQVKRAVFFFFSNYQCSFAEELVLKSSGSQRWFSYHLKGLFITITDAIHVSFCGDLSFSSDPSNCQNIQYSNFSSPSQLSDSSEACHGASNKWKLVA